LNEETVTEYLEKLKYVLLYSSVFKLLKQNWQNACHRFVEKIPGIVITKYDFFLLFHEAWRDTMMPNNIISGFRRSGKYPFNTSALDYVQTVAVMEIYAVHLQVTTL